MGFRKKEDIENFIKEVLNKNSALSFPDLGGIYTTNKIREEIKKETTLGRKMYEYFESIRKYVR